jgi:hypothetical protein
MACELLSGPHTVVDLATGSNLTGLSQFKVLWLDPVGLLALASPTGDTLVQMDGTAAVFSTTINNMYWGLAVVDGRPWYSVLLGTGSGSVGTNEWALNRVTHVYDTLLSATAPGDQLGPYAHVEDRYLIASGATVRYTANAADSWHVEATLTGFSNGAWFSWAREKGHVWIGGSTGKVVRYNYITKAASSPVYTIGGTGIIGLFYSAKHDVFVSVHSGSGVFQMRVWARTPVPASLSVPTSSPGVAAGRAVTLTTRAMGADSDPCPDEVITWSLTGEGELEVEHSRTDVDGYATNRLVLPVDAAGPNVQVDVALEVA